MLAALISHCCCDPCVTHTASFGANHDAGSITPSGTADWPISSGAAEFDGMGSDLDWTVPVEARSSALTLRIAATGVNLSTAGGGIHILVNGVTVALSVDADTNAVTLSYGSVSAVVGEWLAEGTDLSLTVTATECLTAIRYSGGSASGTVQTLAVVFDPLATSYAMGLDGLPGPAETIETDCCEDPALPAVIKAVGSVILPPGCSFHGPDCSLENPQYLTFQDGSQKWEGFRPIDEGGGLQELEFDCPPGSTSPRLVDLSSSSEATLVSFQCDPFEAVYDLNISTLQCTGDGVTLTGCGTYRVTLTDGTGEVGGGAGGTRFDNVRLTACGEVPARDCTQTVVCDGVTYTIPKAFEVVVPGESCCSGAIAMYLDNDGGTCTVNYYGHGCSAPSGGILVTWHLYVDLDGGEMVLEVLTGGLTTTAYLYDPGVPFPGNSIIGSFGLDFSSGQSAGEWCAIGPPLNYPGNTDPPLSLTVEAMS